MLVGAAVAGYVGNSFFFFTKNMKCFQSTTRNRLSYQPLLWQYL